MIASAPLGGKVHVYRGRDGEVLLTLEAAQEGERFGRYVIGIGDADGDCHSDLLVGSPQWSLPGEGGDGASEENAGETGRNADRVAVYSGKDGALLHEWRGETGDRLGAAVAGQVG